MMARQQVFEIVGIPEVSPVDDGTYSQTANGVTWKFTVRDDEATVTGVSGAVSGDLSIPEKLGGRVVTAIGESAFYKSDIATVTLPATIKSIGENAFYKCASLTTVRIMGEEPSVGDNVFFGVSASASVVFPGGTALAGLSNGKWQGMTVIRITGSRGMASGEKISGAVVVPDAINWQPVTVVGAGLFASCEDITSVTIPATVTGIEREAFRGCTRLESIALPDGLLSIADGAFERCTSLTNVTIPASVTNIGYFAFRDCLRLTDVVLKGNPPRQDLGVYMGVPAFTTLSGRMGSATAIVYAEVTNKTEEITVPERWSWAWPCGRLLRIVQLKTKRAALATSGCQERLPRGLPIALAAKSTLV